MNNEDFKILIVDDTLKNLQLLGEFLKQKNYKLHIAQDGLQALQKLENLKPDLILLDVMMPYMSGFEVCEKVKADPILRDIPIIFLTAKVGKEDIIKGFQLGAVDYITKPFNSEELLQRVQTHLTLRQNQQLLEKANYEQRELLHILTHDLMNSVGGASVILKAYQKGQFDLDFTLKVIEEYLERGKEVIELNRQRISLAENKYSIKLVPLNLKESIETSVRMLFFRYQEKEIEIVTEILPHIMILAEPISLINSVFNNLLTNALKFSYPKSSVRIYATEHEDKVLMGIQDYGTGIPEKIMNNIFNPAKSRSLPGTLKETGTGFGMPLVKDFMESYGGGIEISSRPNSEKEKDYGTVINLTFSKNNS